MKKWLVEGIISWPSVMNFNCLQMVKLGLTFPPEKICMSIFSLNLTWHSWHFVERIVVPMSYLPCVLWQVKWSSGSGVTQAWRSRGGCYAGITLPLPSWKIPVGNATATVNQVISNSQPCCSDFYDLHHSSRFVKLCSSKWIMSHSQLRLPLCLGRLPQENKAILRGKSAWKN